MHSSLQPPTPPALSPSPSAQDRKGPRAIALLYMLFFLLWLTGYAMGLAEADCPLWLGMPAWFVFSCFFAFLAIIPALIFVTRRYFS